MTGPDDEIVFRPIGVAKTPFRERADAPRQAVIAKDVEGSIELFAGRGYEDALDDLETFSHVWLLFLFDRNVGHFRPKVLPPRSKKRVGLFASRSPHRPNPIGMSAVELVGIEGRVLRVRGIDLLDGTPILDIKPYVAYADSVASASQGWLAKDPLLDWEVAFSDKAERQLAFLLSRGVDLRGEIAARLALGPQPHAYRRIKTEGGRTRLALKEWRIFFGVAGRVITVETIETGYRKSQLAAAAAASGGGAPDLHREYAEQTF